MRPRRKTGFDRYFAERMEDPRFAAEYRAGRAEIDTIDELIRALDRARVAGGLTKAELARRIDAQPEMIRRLLTAPRGNPTLATILAVASALGYHLELVPNSGGRRVASRRQERGPIPVHR